MIRLAFVAGHHPRQAFHTQFYLPDLLHLVSLLSGTGTVSMRTSVYGIIVSYLQAMLTVRASESDWPDLSSLIEECQSLEVIRLFGLSRSSPSSTYFEHNPAGDRVFIENQTRLTQLLVRIMATTASSTGEHLRDLSARDVLRILRPAKCLASPLDGPCYFDCFPAMPSYPIPGIYRYRHTCNR